MTDPVRPEDIELDDGDQGFDLAVPVEECDRCGAFYEVPARDPGVCPDCLAMGW